MLRVVSMPATVWVKLALWAMRLPLTVVPAWAPPVALVVLPTTPMRLMPRASRAKSSPASETPSWSRSRQSLTELQARSALVKLAIGVEIEVGQGVEAIDGTLAVELDGVDAEQLAAGVDGAVAVEVAHQDAVVGADPAGAGADAVGVVVEEDGAGGALQLQAVAVQIEHQGVDRLAPSAGVTKAGVGVTANIAIQLMRPHSARSIRVKN